MTEVIDRNEPAIMVCHWPGIYYNGEELGFRIFKTIVKRMHERYDNLVWMKLSELARYWAARELTTIKREGQTIRLRAPFATEDFTLELNVASSSPPTVTHEARTTTLSPVRQPLRLAGGTFHREGEQLRLCFPLANGETVVRCA